MKHDTVIMIFTSPIIDNDTIWNEDDAITIFISFIISNDDVERRCNNDIYTFFRQ